MPATTTPTTTTTFHSADFGSDLQQDEDEKRPSSTTTTSMMMMSSMSASNSSMSSRLSAIRGSSSSHRRLLLLNEEVIRLFDFSNKNNSRRRPLLKLYGREREQQVLQDAFQRTLIANNNSDAGSTTSLSSKQELVLLSGPSGSGKTALVDHTLRPLVVGTSGGFFLSGKFDPNKRGMPYHVFCQALTQYATRLVEESSPKQLKVIRESLSRAVGSDEGRMLIQMIPALKHVLSSLSRQQHEDDESDDRRATIAAQPEAIHRFRFVFLNLMRAICQHHAVVLFLDDLQWADTASLELMRALLLHVKGVPLLLVGAHRAGDSNSNNNNNTSSITSTTTTTAAAFSPILETIKEWKRTSACIQVELKPLSEGDVNQLLADVLQHTPKHTLPLAQVVTSQTEGNPFHVLQFLRLLKDQGFLYLDHTEDDEEEVWCWNRQEINSQRLHAHSVLELVKEKLNKLPRFVQELLRVASCMGDEVDDSALAIVMMMNNNNSRLYEGLQAAATAGFLLFLPQTGGYRFAHDRIKEAAYQTIENKAEFLLKIGRRLWKSSSAAALESNVFSVVGLMNKGLQAMEPATANHALPMKERYRLAKLNLMAGKQAMSLASFHDACIYFDKGVGLLGDACWKTEYALSLELYSLLADIMVWKADYDRVQDLIATIFERTQEANKPLEDRLPAYSTLIHCLGQQGDYALAVKTGLDVLQKLGYKLPKKATKLVIARELLRTKAALRGKTNAFILDKLGPMTCPNKMQIAKFLNQVFFLCYTMRSPYASIIAFRSIRVCLKYGRHDGAAIAFATYGAILCGVTRQVREGYRWGQLAVSLMEASQQKELLPKVYVVVVAGINHWTMPLKESMDKFIFAHRVGMETGDVATSLLNAVMSTWYSFFSGTPLDALQQESLLYTEQLEIHKQENVLLLQNVVTQVMDNLCGRQDEEEPYILNGNSLKWKEALEEASTTHNGTATSAIHLSCCIVAYIFGEYELAAHHATKTREALQSNTPTSTYLGIILLFYSGLAATALAKKPTTTQRKRRHYLALARRNQKRLASFAKDCPWNSTHKALLLKAEIRATTKSKCDNAIMILYHQAILGAKREGFIQEAAMACECAADYVIASEQDGRMASSGAAAAERYLTQAHGYYLQWGATAKASALVPRLVEVSGDFAAGGASGEFSILSEL